MSLTIGEVAGLINVGLLFLQLTIPVLQAIALLGGIRMVNSAVTWSVVSRFVQSTFLPTLLQTDVSAGRRDGVSFGVMAMVYLSLATSFLLALAQVLSPIGLSEGVRSDQLVNATFAYAPDPSIFGEATFSRDNYRVSRTCLNGNKPCPGVGLETAHDDGGHVVFSPLVPENITDCFSSCVSSPGDLRSSSFNIEFRQFSVAEERTKDKVYNNVTGIYRYIGQVALEQPGYHVKEGIIIDSIDGGIGFRNHTVPTNPVMTDGATWTEDLLWIVPQTSCIGTNWTFYSRPQLTPYLNAFTSPVQDNIYATYKTTPPSSSRRNWTITPDALLMGTNDFLSLVSIYDEASGFTTVEPTDYDLDGSPVTVTEGNATAVQTCADQCVTALNDCEVTCGLPETSATVYFLKDATRACRNYTRESKPSIDIPFVICHYFVPSPLKFSHQGMSSTNDLLALPISICATGLEATVKQVRFSYNDTGGGPSLSGLQVLDVSPTKYDKDEDKPLWAVENPGSNWTIDEISLQWGMISKEASLKYADGIRTLRSEKLPLPVFLESAQYDSGWGDSLGGARGPGMGLSILFRGSYSGSGGLGDFAAFLRWQNLTSDPQTMHKLTNIRWTDIVSDLLTGTKSRFSATAGSDPSIPVTGEVQVYRKMVRYQYKYGTVAFLCCAIWLLWALICLVMVIAPRLRAKMSPSGLSAMINKLSVGRAFVAGKDREKWRSFEKTTKHWLEKDSKRVIDLSKWPSTPQENTNNKVDNVLTEGETLIEGDEQGKERSSETVN
ncbi:hypothetical protein B0T19DRAFT_472860 [Cercophora scortea]|uniref:Uncharacterized protein n=1 Tax=Cercophora scortea TaxID=314031 RepID=A0AAE0IVE9_9PEZI|nr:hypothetical protein B0T19DRAFT_472860 [Cercophora scortea]